MRLLFCSALLLLSSVRLCAWPPPKLTGLYVQWGYNRDHFSKSDIRFRRDGAYDFTLHDLEARDQPDFAALWESPIDITIPQNSFRLGAYLNDAHSWAVEINFDHAKYVIVNSQRARLTGTIGNESFEKDTVIHPAFLQFEHTNGANFWNLNFVRQRGILHSKSRLLATAIGKAGAGIVIPRSDVALFGKKQDNVYHIAGYIVNVEAGLRIYPLRHLFFEATAKVGFANYLHVLTVDSGRARHSFFFGEVIGLVGYEISL